jgi:multidrug efflux pump subunit AcrA (membrane-fusion protein)
MFVNILLDNDLNSDSKILVEKASIVNRDQLTGVYVVDNNKASLRWVRLGKTVDDKVEVLSGINNSDKIVGKADGKLFNGVTVSVKN